MRPEQLEAVRTWDVQKGPSTKVHIAVDSFGMPVRVIITDGTAADCSKACELIDGFDADYLLVDRGYDTDVVIEQVQEEKMEAVIPPKKNRKVQRKYDKDIYENRYQVENTFLKLKRWRGNSDQIRENNIVV